MLRSPYELNLWNLAKKWNVANDVHLALGEKHANGALKRRAPGSSAVLGQRGENRHYRLSLSQTGESIFRSNIDSAIVCAVCRESERARERVRPVSRAVRRRCSFKKVECSPSARASEINCLPRRERESRECRLSVLRCVSHVARG